MVTRDRDDSYDSDTPVYGSAIDRALSKWFRAVRARSEPVQFGLSVAVLVAVTALDYLTGSEINLSLFYLLPVGFAGGIRSRRAGAAMAFVSAAVWGMLEYTTGRPYSALWILYWNTAVRLGFFLLVNELVERLRRSMTHIAELSRTDPLTGISNARMFDEYATRAIAESRRRSSPFTLVYVDLDAFKAVNDQFGHSEGDRLLKSVAAIILQEVRSTDVAARLGGDEFGVLMPDTQLEQARVVLERIAGRMAVEVGSRWGVAATFGAVTFDEPPGDVDIAVRLADALMYRGKAEGAGRILQEAWPEPGAGT